MATIMNLTPCRVCSEVYRGFFLKAGPLSLSFHHLKGNWWRQSSTAVNINKFSCCNKSQFKHLQGPSDSDLNSRAVFFGVDIRNISERQFKISNGPVTIIQEPQKRRRVFIESDYEEQCWFRVNCIFFYRHGRTAFEQVWSTFLYELTFLTLAVDSWECRWKFSRHIVFFFAAVLIIAFQK